MSGEIIRIILLCALAALLVAAAITDIRSRIISNRLNIAIALASITVLTDKKWLLWGAAGAALIGCGFGVVAYLPIGH